jgi:hypothetical protein
MKIGSVIVLYLNLWVEASAGGLLVPEDLYSPVANTSILALKYVYELNCQKKVIFINSSENEELAPLAIALSFDGFCLISWHSVLAFIQRLFHSFHSFPGFPTFST